MTITCPKCGFAREADEARIPAGPVAVTCPRCQEKFTLNREETPVSPAAPAEGTSPSPAGENLPSPPPPQVRCPVCGEHQAAAEVCIRCGAALVAKKVPDFQLPFAGFWVRVVAWIVDSALVSILQFFLSLALSGVIGLVIGPLSEEGDLGMTVLMALFGMVLAVAYYVFFTGYSGQTPGKMLMRIKVVRTDGTALTYGRAFLREVIGKFTSGIILGIGYLMVAFDNRKQGLHDKMADTFVIKI